MRAHEQASLKLSGVIRLDGRIRSAFTLPAEQTNGHHAMACLPQQRAATR